MKKYFTLLVGMSLLSIFSFANIEQGNLPSESREEIAIRQLDLSIRTFDILKKGDFFSFSVFVDYITPFPWMTTRRYVTLSLTNSAENPHLFCSADGIHCFDMRKENLPEVKPAVGDFFAACLAIGILPLMLPKMAYSRLVYGPQHSLESFLKSKETKSSLTLGFDDAKSLYQGELSIGDGGKLLMQPK